MSRKIVNGLNSVEKIVGGILVAVLFVILLYQTVGRNIGISATWTDEAARYLFVLLVYVGAGLAMLLGKHITIDILVYIWPKAIRAFIETLGSVIGTVFCLFVLYSTLQYNFELIAGGRVSPSLGIAMSIPYTAVNIGYFLLSVRLIQAQVIPNIKGLAAKKAERNQEEGREES